MSMGIKFNGKDIKWDVYRSPEEIIGLFVTIRNQLIQNNKFYGLSNDIKEYFNNISSYQIDKLKIETDYICKAFKDCFVNPVINMITEFSEFLGISNFSFTESNESGLKPFEGYANKKADPKCCRRWFNYICPCLDYFMFNQYNKRWIILKDEFIDYANGSLADIEKQVYFFDKSFEVHTNPNEPYILKIVNGSRELVLKFDTIFEKYLWKQEILKRESKQKEILKNNKYQSYATPKCHNKMMWFNDGQKYFTKLYDDLLNAKDTVFITDWWMSPEVYLKRPVKFNDYIKLKNDNQNFKTEGELTRLMDILYYLAERKGIKIYIMVYKEKTVALTLNSEHTENAFFNHPNIQFVRHPTDIMVILWSHHEKLVVIDQTIGYVGGLDLCWGRYDTNEHPLSEAPNLGNNYHFPGIDYSNARINDFTNVEDYLKENVDRKTTPRMPWHDVHIRIEGDVVPDIARHFVERWNDAKFESREGAIAEVKSNSSSTFLSRQEIDLRKEGTQDNRFFSNLLQKVAHEKQIAKDEKKANLIEIDDIKEQNQKTNLRSIPNILQEKQNNPEEEINTSNAPTKGLTIINKMFGDKRMSKKTISKLINFMKGKVFIDKDHAYMTEEEYNAKMEEQRQRENQSWFKKIVNDISEKAHQTKESFDRMRKNEMPLQISKALNRRRHKKFLKEDAVVQVLRSSCKWSAGLKETEHSILNGYYKLIDESKHFIYIENQFFVSRSWDQETICEKDFNEMNVTVENEIALHIFRRLEKAVRNDENFKVVVFIPLLPGFAGEPEQSYTLQLIVKHTYFGICQNNGYSIMEQLDKVLKECNSNKTVYDYINFYSLRTHDIIAGKAVTEIIYIHSKLMIVDDRHLLIGSANINDRSMLGDRDSEFAVIVTETPKIGKMNGEDAYISKNVRDFRKALYAEHIGLDMDDSILDDPLSSEINDELNGRAKNNTETYRKIFLCYPDDTLQSFEDIRNKCNRSTEEINELYLKYKDDIHGHVVQFPLDFLKNEVEHLGDNAAYEAATLLPERNFT